jgi:hypothetical protein
MHPIPAKKSFIPVFFLLKTVVICCTLKLKLGILFEGKTDGSKKRKYTCITSDCVL